MLNARTLAQAPTAGDTSGPDLPENPSLPSEPARPVEAFQTKEGVIVLSNRPAGEGAAPAPATAGGDQPPAATPEAARPVPKAASSTQAAPTQAAPAQAAPAPVPREAARSEGSAGLWLLLAAVVIAIATVALLLVRRKRRRTTERYAALLAGSEPIAPAPDEHVGPYARRRSATSTVTPLPASSSGGPSSARAMSGASRTPLPAASDEHSAPPPSGIAPPPTSERQWLSQRPPRSYKEPPS